MDKQFWNEYTTNKHATNFSMDLLLPYAHGNVLDLGCGDGTHAGELATLVKDQAKIYGIDPSDNIIGTAKSNYPNINFQDGSAYDLPYDDNFFDLVYAIDVIEHLHHPEKMLAEAKRILKPSGIMVIQTPNYPIKRVYDYYIYLSKHNWRNSPRDDRTHFYKFTAWHLKKMCSQFFTVIDFMTRNIFLEKRLPFISKAKKNPLGITFGQKTIIILKK